MFNNNTELRDVKKINEKLLEEMSLTTFIIYNFITTRKSYNYLDM